MRRGVWATLDLDPTTDRAAIRRAYATRLKAMDVDADPAGFARLRAARDQALAHAADPDPVTGPAFDPEPQDDVAPPPPPPSPPSAGAIEAAARIDAIDAHYRALRALLFVDDDAPPTADELAAIEHHGRALLGDPRLEQVDFATDAERWFAEILAASVPRSDPLLEPAAKAFGWIARRDDYALLPEAQAIVERIGATRLAALLADPGHRQHKAWIELTRADAGRRHWSTSPTSVRDLLATVRQRYPDVEGWMNPERVAKWSRPAGDRPRMPVRFWIVLFLIVAAVRIGANWSSPTKPDKLDADYVAQTLTGKELAEVQKVNPGLALDIVAAVANAEAPANRTEEAMAGNAVIGKLTAKRLQAGMNTPPKSLLLHLTRFDLDAMRAVRAGNPAACTTANVAMAPDLLPQYLRDRQRELLREVMLHTQSVAPVNRDHRFDVPGAIVEEIAKRTGWPVAKIRQVLRDDKDPAARCTLEIALREAGLAAQNGMGLQLLRDVQPLVVVAGDPPTVPK
ncbi:hypothetical protein QLH51_01720 [Sphingomonas sp. 2R-10]|uniref:hypothetical protein n=1 Tax=Sphingomonas sp. 2R-10 TaxID=3045148 RepID=UPI000F7B81EE|nr:hypothetical protein [Sphingomonas sp. 2R-10]MDJ0275526.1 hypothetical protein [Sphingomonas sp. 2R-10]